MKVWYKKNDLNYREFPQELFLLIKEYSDEVILKNKDFIYYKDWVDNIQNLTIVSNIVDCDCIVYPRKLDAGIVEYIEVGKKYKKEVIAFYNDDNEKSIKLDGVSLFRTSLTKQTKKPNEYSMPAWSVDFKKYTDIVMRDKVEKPVISFCGAITHPLRYECLGNLQQNDNINLSILLRNAFWGGEYHNKQLRDEYVKNMKTSDLVLCCRGAGNFSYRLYECLSLGKIPVIIDSDIVLPCSDKIDWNRFIITTSQNINTDIDMFWKNISSREYQELQRYSREIYERYISPLGFINYIITKYDAR